MRTDGRGPRKLTVVEDLFECRACNRGLERTSADSLRCTRCRWAVGSADGYWDFLAERIRLPAFEWRLRDVYREICAGNGPAEAWGARPGSIVASLAFVRSKRMRCWGSRGLARSNCGCQRGLWMAVGTVRRGVPSRNPLGGARRFGAARPHAS